MLSTVHYPNEGRTRVDGAGGRATRYRVVDLYLWFWLRFIGPALADVESGWADLAVTRAADGWSSYRGRAVEPLVRQSLDRLGAGARTRCGAGLRRLLDQGHRVGAELVIHGGDLRRRWDGGRLA